MTTEALAYVPEVGHRVRVQRWEVPCPDIPGTAERRLLIEMDGTVESVRELAGGYLIKLAGDDADPIFTGYQFSGQDPDHGCSWSLRTEVIKAEDVAAHDQAVLDAGVALAEHEKAAALATWERARDAEAIARQRLKGAQERLEAATGRAGVHRRQAGPADLDALTERRKGDRAVMAAHVADLARMHGLTAEVAPGLDKRELCANLAGPHGLRLTVRFRGDSPQCEPDTYVLSWCLLPRMDDGYRLNPHVFEAVNSHHGCKATEVANGYRELCELLSNRFAHIMGRTAFVLDGTAV
jgi:hypothetical protein